MLKFPLFPQHNEHNQQHKKYVFIRQTAREKIFLLDIVCDVYEKRKKFFNDN